MNASKLVALLALALAPLATFGWTIFPDDRMLPDKASPELVAVFEEFKALAEKGDIHAQFKLGFCYYIGCGIPARDYKLAVEWYRKSAEAGLADAQYEFSGCFGGLYTSEILPKNDELAKKWLMKAAVQMYPKALCTLGVRHEKGWDGFLKDEMEAYAYYNLAASLGNRHAAFNLKEIESKMTSEQRLAGQKRSKELLKELESKR